MPGRARCGRSSAGPRRACRGTWRSSRRSRDAASVRTSCSRCACGRCRPDGPATACFMLRMTASLSATPAIFGRYSHTCRPVTLVWIGRNGPPVGRPGFMSKVSIWLAPPFIHSRMQRLPRFCASATIACELNRPPQLATVSPPPVTSAPLRNARRLRCSRVEQTGLMVIRPFVPFAAWLMLGCRAANVESFND